MKEKFDTFKFKPETQALIQMADKIINEYQEQGYDLTLRQLYYQFVARDIIPNSQTAMYEESKRFIYNIKQGKQNIILHLGDHDPSGIDMTRDIEERLNDCFDVDVSVKRIALNIEQIEHFSPPPNPAKLTDSRCHNYIKKFGRLSWELDALSPITLTKLISSEVNEYTNNELLQELQQEQ